MAEHEQEYLAQCRRDGICPRCQKPIPPGAGHGTGRHADGLFCSLDCFATYNQAQLIERHRARVRNARGAGSDD